MTDPRGTRWSADQDLGDGVRVWYFSLDLGPEGYAECTRTLDDKERDRARRFRFEEHRRRFVAGRGTLRMILGHYADCEPKCVRLEYGEHGKPYIAGPGAVGDLKLSVSHSGPVGAVGVARRFDLGLDLEEVRPSNDHDLVASREFSVDERNWYLGLPDERRPAAFFDLWTCKEAYLKGKGLGLNASLDRFSVSLGQDMPPRLAWSEIDREDPHRWRLHRLVLNPGFVACLAVDGECRAIQSARWRPSA
jgi:4'-phosphopantetheinyl transferase